MKSTRSGTAAQNRHARGGLVSSYAPNSNLTANVNRVANGTPGPATDEYSEGGFDET